MFREDPDALVVSSLGPVYANNQKRILTIDDTLYYSKGGAWVKIIAGGAPPTGVASGDLAGTYPSPTVPAKGSDTQVQFNDGGVRAGDAGFTYNKTTDKATLVGGLFITPLTTGSVLFAKASGEIGQNNAQIFWNDGSGFLAIGRNTTLGTAPKLIVGGNLILGPSSGNGSAQFILAGQANRNDFLFYDSLGSQKCSLGYVGPTAGANPDTAQLSGAPNGLLFLNTGFAEQGRIDNSGNFVWTTAALATNAVNGFMFISTSAGPPTGTPTTYTGRAPLHYDSTNDVYYVYNFVNSLWRPIGGNLPVYKQSPVSQTIQDGETFLGEGTITLGAGVTITILGTGLMRLI